MANTNRATSDSVALEQALQSQPYKFGFYQTLRRFECLNPDKPKIGMSVRLADDVLRLTQEPSVIFAPSALAAFKPSSELQSAKLAVNFFGMFGPNGPLPLHLTEYARDRLRNSDDPTFSEFINIFHHRMLSLFYRAWSCVEPTVHFDRPEQDRFSFYTGSLLGLGMPAMRDRDEIPDLVKLHFSGRLSSQARNVEGLVAIIKHFFNVPAAIEEFVGEWMKLPINCMSRLGVTAGTGALGINAVIGDYVWQCQQKFRIILGPLEYKDYKHMLPGRDSSKRLRAIVRNYVGDSMNWEVRLVLKKEEVPGMRLGRDDLLGWNTWLGDRISNDDADDLALEQMRVVV